MKISVQKSILEQVLSQMQPFLEKKDTSQITSHIYISAKDNILTLKATDYEMGLKAAIDNITIKNEGNATANGKKLLDIVRILKDNEVTLEKKEDTIKMVEELVRKKNSLNTYTDSRER
jgi:DNA polymerase-3 subunit beta